MSVYGIFTVCLASLVVSVSLPAQAILRSVLSSGAAEASGAAIIVHATVGQTVIGPSQQASTSLQSGFWNSYSLAPSSSVPDGPVISTRLCVYPQPVETKYTIQYKARCPGIVRIELLNILGMKLGELYTGYVSGVVSINADSEDTPGGMYIVRVICPCEQLSAYMIIHH